MVGRLPLSLPHWLDGRLFPLLRMEWEMEWDRMGNGGGRMVVVVGSGRRTDPGMEQTGHLNVGN